MAADKMPLMLDNAMSVDLHDVDDLFGDDVALPISLRPPQGKQLLARLDELRSRGCCSSVAWSRSGTIASLTPDGQTLQLRFLSCQPENGSWELSEPTICEVIKGTPAIPLVHLEWSGTTSPELAVVDATGRVAIASFPISLNQPFVTRKWDPDVVDDSHAVVGSYWLPIGPIPQQKQQYNIIHGPARRHGSTYQYETSFSYASGPSHPHLSKSALLCVTMGGMLKMYWWQSNNRMEETLMELESVNSSDEVLANDSIAESLLVALATSSFALKLLRLDLRWVAPGPMSDKTLQSQNTRLSLKLDETHLAYANWLHSGPNEPNHDPSVAALSYLHLLPSMLDNTGKSTVPPVIVTIRSRAAEEGSFETAQSILDRWEAVEERQTVPAAFEQLGNRRPSLSSDLPNLTRLRKLEPIIINKVVIGLQTIQFGKILLITMSDGTVEYRDRYSFEEVFNAEDLTRVMNLRQVGWNFADNGPCQQVAFSPTQCSMMLLADDGKLRWSKLHHPIIDAADSVQDARYVATIAALAVTAASSIWYQSNYDDLLAVVHPMTTRNRFTQEWVSELIRILKIQIDYTEELHHDTLMRNAPLQACFSIMNSLGFRGEAVKRTFQSKLAWVLLNMRNVVVLITLASNTPVTVRDRMSPLDEHEVVDALTGCVKWSLALLSWLADSLFALIKDENFMQRLVPQRFAEMATYLHQNNEVALHLILCSSSRSFLSALCRRVAHLQALSNKAIEFYKRQGGAKDASNGARLSDPRLQEAYLRMQQVTTSSLINVSEFEKLLNTLGADIRQAYQTILPSRIKSGPNPPQGKQLEAAIKTAQVQFEVGIMLTSSPPMAFLAVLKKLMCHDVGAFRELTDPAALFFADYSMLGLLDDEMSLSARRASSVSIDLFRKIELKPGGLRPGRRRCARCTAVMEDVYVSKAGFTFILSQQRRCSCAGHWTLPVEGKDAS
ncbi:hypothetical protein L249_3518 [Ophiocordyceps polyrhachis-furcata BCC 54312]|uniref:Mediator of RNA polymerase II transcription subunit 16 n=1 Tax=Ophiocordyceps polyrhachis-furcata BCC 54312 TaxID=1330021 RepID=A0A367LM63_9HYPO|nr:hypothetical protein L249_3518 [Ophiocordyceps polyrhachis-furcata BCC 54312]